MSKLKRYNVGEFDEGDGYMCSYEDESPSGDWVRFEDAKELEQERDTLKARVEELDELIKHIYHFGTIMTLEDHKAMMNWSKQ